MSGTQEVIEHGGGSGGMGDGGTEFVEGWGGDVDSGTAFVDAWGGL